MFLSYSNYVWTNHAKFKMAFYNISENRVRRVIKTPLRVEEGIAENTVAFMQPTSYKTKNGKRTWNQELWVMATTAEREKEKVESRKLKKGKKLKIISAWRYPGVTKERGELPNEILKEIAQAIASSEF